MEWLLVAAASLLGGLGAVLLIGAALLLRTPMSWLAHLFSLAVGTLLGTAFLGLLPEAIERLEPGTALALVLAVLLAFFVFEKLLLVHHWHGDQPEPYRAAPTMILVGDAFHNAIDGVAIGAAFVVSVPLGLVTALAVALHEIPQEVGDYAVLIEGGFSTRKAIFWNSFSALPPLPMALLAYWSLSAAEAAVGYLLVIGAGAFIYIALADLVPILHRSVDRVGGLLHLALVLLGVGLIVALEALL